MQTRKRDERPSDGNLALAVGVREKCWMTDIPHNAMYVHHPQQTKYTCEGRNKEGEEKKKMSVVQIECLKHDVI